MSEPAPSLPSGTTTASNNNDAAEISRLKRKITAMQEEIDEAANAKVKKPVSTVTMGRGIRRLVTLFDSLEDLIDEADQHFQDDDSDAEPEDDLFLDDETYERRRQSQSRYSAYTTLLQVLPCVKTMIEDPNSLSEELATFLMQLQKGANDARSDDVRRIKEEVALWLNHEFAPTPPMLVKSRNDRGIQNDITERLLCLIEHDWEEEKIYSEIQDGTLDISEDHFLRCFYPNGNGDPENVESGFLRSALLVKTYCTIFTSPSSSDAFDDEDENGPACKSQQTSSQKKATKSNVAMLLHMEGKVTARSIAYAAVLLAFNLTDATQWVRVYGQINFCALYTFIVDFFEEPSGTASAKRTASLLKWWNKQVFPDHVNALSNTRRSRNKLAAQRAAREESVEI